MGTQFSRAAAMIAAAVALIAVTPAPGGAAVSRAMAAGAESCSFADEGTGTYARSLCWFDLSGYDQARAASPDGQPMRVDLPGGYSISFTLTTSGGPVHPAALPTYGGAYLGNSGHYTGVTGKPALYQSNSGTTSTAILSDIVVTDAQGNQVTGYSFVGADAEATDARESITWTADTPLDLISDVGNACDSGAGLTGVGTTMVKCASSQSSAKTGTAILAAEHPAWFSQTMVGSGLQAVAFGVLVSTVRLNKDVASRVDPADGFRVSVAAPNGSVLGTSDTGTDDTATTGDITVLADEADNSYLLSESATSGLLSNYDSSWSCTRNGAPDDSLPSGPAASAASVSLGIGDFVDCTITNTAKSASLSLVKRVASVTDTNMDGIIDAGDTIAYGYDVTNTGELTLHDIGVADAKTGPVTCAADTLASGATTTCTAAPYTITAEDEAAGAANNTATASGSPPGSDVKIHSAPSSTSTPVETPRPRVSLTKVPRAAGGDTNPVTVGETIDYTFLVVNTGDDNLTSVTVTDAKVGPVACPTPAPPGLPPGHAVTCTATYTVTQADVNSGHVHNTATATGTDADGNTSPDSTDSADVPTVTPAPTVAVVKSATVTPAADQDGAKVGDTIDYSYSVTNTGNVDLATVAVHDPAGGPVTCPVPPSPGLAPGDSVTCTADTSHTVTEADVDAGHVTDTATATGTDTQGKESPPSAPSTAVVPAAEPAPRVSLAKSGTVTPAADQGGVKAGDTIHYRYVVTNTGNVDLATVSVYDPTGGHVSCPVPPSPGLAPRDSETCTADAAYPVTQADVDAGHVTDRSIAIGRYQPPSGPARPSAPSNIATVVIPATPAAPTVSIDKEATVTPIDDQGGAKLADTITYTYIVTNTGNVDLASVTVTDPKLGAVSCPRLPAPGLAPGEKATCTATAVHTVTGADVARGKVTDTATAAGTDDSGTRSPDSDPSTAVVLTEAAAPAVSIRKFAVVSPHSDQDGAKLGDTISYSYLVTNTGNVNLASVAVSDPAGGPVACPALAAPGLEPGGHVICTADAKHTVTEADVRAGHVTDTATATGTDPQGRTSPPSAPSTVVVPTIPEITTIGTDLGRWAPDGGQATAWVLCSLSAAGAAAALITWRRRRARA